jgi:hypothetical protein
MAADNITSVEEATMAIAIIAVATVAVATIAAIATTVAQTRDAYKKAIIKVKENTKAFNRKNATSVTNQIAGLISIS